MGLFLFPSSGELSVGGASIAGSGYSGCIAGNVALYTFHVKLATKIAQKVKKRPAHRAGERGGVEKRDEASTEESQRKHSATHRQNSWS